MDDEKSSGVVIRISMDTADKQCAYLIFLSFPAYITWQLEGHIQQSSRSSVHYVNTRAHRPVPFPIHGICIWPSLLCVPRIFSVVCCLIRFSVYHDNTFDLPGCVS